MRILRLLLCAGLVPLLVASPSLAAELRTIGGTQVDLQPLVDWSAKKKGERPLKHWKYVQVLEFKRQSSYPVFLCDIEGLKTEIMLKNCPGELLTLAEQKTRLQKELEAARDNQQDANQNLSNAANKKQVKQAKRVATAAQKDEKVIRKELDNVNSKIKQHQVLAMATGASLGGVPVWDTGLGAH
jgi:hypothetical protein